MESTESQLREFETISDDLSDLAADIEQEMAAFLEEHPTFAEEFAAYDEDPGVPEPSIRSDRLDDYDARDPVTSEWAFVFKYGFMTGLHEAVGNMHLRTDLPYDNSPEE